HSVCWVFPIPMCHNFLPAAGVERGALGIECDGADETGGPTGFEAHDGHGIDPRGLISRYADSGNATRGHDGAQEDSHFEALPESDHGRSSNFTATRKLM